MDCPEDVNSYIHRAGRTARFQSGGESLLILLPSETNIIDQLHDRKIPISMIKVNSNKFQSPQRKLEALLAQDCALKETAKRAFVTYIKSIFLKRDKNIFNVHALNSDAYARSLGLIIPPKIRFLQKTTVPTKKGVKVNQTNVKKDNYHKQLKNEASSTETFSFNKESDDQIMGNVIQTIKNFEDDDNDEDDILTIKRKNIQIDNLVNDFEEVDNNATKYKEKKALTKAALAKKILKKKIVPNKKISFDENGQEILDSTKLKQSEHGRNYDTEIESGINIEIAKETLRLEDKFDKERFKQKIKEKHREEKEKIKSKKKLYQGHQESEEEDSERAESEYNSDESNLSWSTDSDKIYDKDSVDSSDDNYELTEDKEDNVKHKIVNTENGTNDNEDKIHRPYKRKLLRRKDSKKSKRKCIVSQPSFDILQADEEVALQLLGK